MAVTSIRSETPSQLTLTGVEGERLVLAPLQEKAVDDVRAFDFSAIEREGLVTLVEAAPNRLGDQIATILFGGGVWVGILGAFISNMDPPGGLTQVQWHWTVWLTGVSILAVTAVVMLIRGTNSFSLVVRFTTQMAALAVILAIGLGLPAATIYFFGGGRQLFAGGDAASLAMFGRLIQLSFIATASLLPVLLFFLFDRFQLGTLRRRLYSDLFRLDRSIHTTGEIDAKYGSQIREAYGPNDQRRGRLAPGSRWPVLVCSFVITIGWIVALAPVGSDFAPLDGSQAMGVLMPQRTALAFGVLGVYFYSLRMIAMRYARGDLKPKAYAQIMIRIFIVAVLSWVLQATFDGEATIMLVLAFLFGITPDAFFTWVREAFRGRLPESVLPERTRLPLTDLEGIDLYDRGRLEGEGIVNIEGLAHHEFIDLIIETRVPVPRLVDWIDQSILYLHLAGGTDTDGRARLRDYGIRTATDLLRTWDMAEARAKERTQEEGQKEFTAFKDLLGGGTVPYRLEVIRDALLDDEWIGAIECWRDDTPRDPIERTAVPSTVEALQALAEKQLEQNSYGRALSILEQSLAVRDNAGSRLRMARIYATSPVTQYRDAARAQDNARRAYALAPDDYDVCKELIGIFVEIDDREGADLMYEAARKIVAGWADGKKGATETQALEELHGRMERMPATSTGPRGSGPNAGLALVDLATLQTTRP